MDPARTNNKDDWRPAPDNYEPHSLPGFLDPLIEQLAEKVHDKWAERRITEGWSFGPRRDDERKTTPNLVPSRCLAYFVTCLIVTFALAPLSC